MPLRQLLWLLVGNALVAGAPHPTGNDKSLIVDHEPNLQTYKASHPTRPASFYKASHSTHSTSFYKASHPTHSASFYKATHCIQATCAIATTLTGSDGAVVVSSSDVLVVGGSETLTLPSLTSSLLITHGITFTLQPSHTNTVLGTPTTTTGTDGRTIVLSSSVLVMGVARL